MLYIVQSNESSNKGHSCNKLVQLQVHTADLPAMWCISHNETSTATYVTLEKHSRNYKKKKINLHTHKIKGHNNKCNATWQEWDTYPYTMHIPFVHAEWLLPLFLLYSPFFLNDISCFLCFLSFYTGFLPFCSLFLGSYQVNVPIMFTFMYIQSGRL